MRVRARVNIRVDDKVIEDETEIRYRVTRHLCHGWHLVIGIGVHVRARPQRTAGEGVPGIFVSLEIAPDAAVNFLFEILNTC